MGRKMLTEPTANTLKNRTKDQHKAQAKKDDAAYAEYSADDMLMVTLEMFRRREKQLQKHAQLLAEKADPDEDEWEL